MIGRFSANTMTRNVSPSLDHDDARSLCRALLAAEALLSGEFKPPCWVLALRRGLVDLPQRTFVEMQRRRKDA